MIGIIVVAALIAGGAAFAATGLMQRQASPVATGASPAPPPSAAAEPSVTELDEASMCKALVPLLNEAVDLLTAYAKGQPWDRGRTQALYTVLLDLYKRAPAGMKSDVGDQASGLSSMLANQAFSRERVMDSGTRLSTRCRKYATG